MSDFVTELKRRNVLRVGAAYLIGSWLMLQIVDVVFPMLGLDEALARPILLVLALGFPAALVFAWMFELTPQGLKKEKEVDRSASVTAQTGRKLDRAIIVILVFAIGLLLIDRFVLQDSDDFEVAEAQNLDSVAVLPFVNMSGSAENEYFSDGLTETLLHMLAQVPELKVAARTSAFAFKGREEDIRQIADALDVSTILEGSVQKAGNTVRITAQLIEAESGFHLWSRTYDRNLDDIFLMQDEIANSVADALKSTLLGDSTAASVQLVGVGTTNTEAYENYLRGLEQKNIGSYSSFPQAEGLFKEALALDPSFNEAKVELADTYREQSDTGLITRDLANRRARPLLEQVLTANPRHGRALGNLAVIDFQEAAAEMGPTRALRSAYQQKLTDAIALAPSEPELHSMMANFHIQSNNDEEALVWFNKSIELDPLSAELQWQHGSHLLFNLDDPDGAETSLASARALAPEWTAPYSTSAAAALRRGDFGAALKWDLKSMEIDPQDHELPAEVGRFFYRLGFDAEGDQMLARAQSLAPDSPVTRSLEVQRHYWDGNFERAATLSENMIRDEVEDRRGAWNMAMSVYAGSKIELGRPLDVPALMESLVPGISSPDFEAGSFQQRISRYFITVALADDGAYEEANAIFEPLVEWFSTNVPQFDDNHGAQMNIALIRGDYELAADQALLAVEGRLGKNMGWRDMLDAPWTKPIVNEPRVAARMAELEAETAVAAEQVRQYLAENDLP